MAFAYQESNIDNAQLVIVQTIIAFEMTEKGLNIE